MKVIPPCNSLSVAQKVKRLCNRLNVDSRLCANANWESFDNCREQGLVLNVQRFCGKSLRLAVAENRNSDNIVVYYYHERAFPTNLPADNEWENCKYFEPVQNKKRSPHLH